MTDHELSTHALNAKVAKAIDMKWKGDDLVECKPEGLAPYFYFWSDREHRWHHWSPAWVIADAIELWFMMPGAVVLPTISHNMVNGTWWGKGNVTNYDFPGGLHREYKTPEELANAITTLFVGASEQWPWDWESKL